MEKDNKRFRGYNANPQLYQNIDAIRNDLERVADMKFRTIWLNPLFETCAAIPTNIPNPDSLPGSPYAQRTLNIARRFSNHPELPDEKRRKQDYADIRRLTDHARELGMNTITDLVLNHVAIDNPMVNSKATEFHVEAMSGSGPAEKTVTIDTSRWFKRHKETTILPIQPIFVAGSESENLPIQVTNLSSSGANIDTPPIQVINRSSSGANIDTPPIEVTNRSSFGANIDTPPIQVTWGNLMIHGRDANLQRKGTKKCWDDVAMFNFDDPEIRKEIITYYIKPLIKTMIVDMGYEGFRFDAAGMIRPEVYQEIVPYMDEICKKEHGKPTANIAETVGAFFHEHIRMGQTADYPEGFASHAYDSTFFAATDSFDFHSNRQGELFGRDDGWPAHIRGTMDGILRGGSVRYYDKRTDQWVTEEVQGGKRGVGSITSSLGNHDEVRYVETLRKEGITEPAEVRKSLKRKLAVGAFFSSAGHFMQIGDEWGVRPQASVFTAKPEDLKDRMPGIDLTDFTREINVTLSRLPDPTEAGIGWAQVVALPDKPDLMGVITHHGPGHNGQRDLVIINISDHPQELDSQEIKAFMIANGRNQGERETSIPEVIHLVGGINPSVGLQTMARQERFVMHDASEQDNQHLKAPSVSENLDKYRKPLNSSETART